MYFSVDPYLRGRIDDAKSYVPPLELGKPNSVGVIAKLVKSNSINFKKNGIVTRNLPWQQHSVAKEINLIKID